MDTAPSAAVDAIPLAVGPEQDVPPTLLVKHDRVAADDGVAALALLGERIEGPVGGTELLHCVRLIRDGLRAVQKVR
jgi:hypothetical protein